MSDDVKIVEFYGESFKVQSEPSEFALMEFADLAETGIDDAMMAGMAAVKRFAESTLIESEIPRWRKVARKNRASTTALMAFVNAAWADEEVAERPTGLPVDSSDGQPDIEPKSAASSDAKGSDRLTGRPDLRVAVARTKSA